ncbi:S1 family peptidase [Kribbella sp. NPDC003505]|uniref:S1 family peptidase n=1 Tax=Kribbella sp. NPDC003505 TaxID=3154448 RepID=UPI0033BF5F1F
MTANHMRAALWFSSGVRRACGRMLAAVAIVGMSAGPLLVPSAGHASSAAPVDTSDVHVTGGISGKNARSLAESLGETRTGGIYLDAKGFIVVAVTDQAAAQAVRAAGGVAKSVRYSTATLKSIHKELDKLAGVRGTSWGVDPSTNQVSVELDSTVNAADTAKINAVAAKFGDAVRVDRIHGKIGAKTYSTGGEMMSVAIAGHQEPRCSLGFNVTNSSGDRYIITAGHCTNNFTTWYQGWSGELLGNTIRSSYPGNDYGIIKYNHSSVVAYGTVHHNTQQIYVSRLPFDGESVSRAGGVSNDMIGQVLLVDTTVTWDSGETVYHTIKTTNCALNGDSGGPLYNGTTALGELSGGTNVSACSDNVSDERTWYQPLQPVLDTYNLAVY